MNGLSRQEIESSVKSSSQERIEPKVFGDSKPTVELENRRESIVLGGDLTGIKASPEQKNYLWWIIGTFLALLVLSVFVLPSFFVERTLISKVKNITVSTDEIYQQTISEEALNDDSDLAKDNFTKVADRERALQYRKEDKTLQQVLELELKVQSAIEKGQYTQPSKDNALFYYQLILALDKKNRKAKKGINYIARRISAVGIEQVNSGNLEKAKSSLSSLANIVDQAEHLDRESTEYVELKIATENLEQQQNFLANTIAESEKKEKEISSLLAKAENAFKKKLFTTPENKSAIYYYKTILGKYPNNINAKIGIQNIIQFYTDKSNEHINSGNWISAKRNIEKITNINKSAPELTILNSLLSTKQSNELAKDIAKEQELLAIEREQTKQAAKLKAQQLARLQAQKQEVENQKALERRNAETQAELRAQQEQEARSNTESSAGRAPVSVVIKTDKILIKNN